MDNETNEETSALSSSSLITVIDKCFGEYEMRLRRYENVEPVLAPPPPPHHRLLSFPLAAGQQPSQVLCI